jgi:hypothetical protein
MGRFSALLAVALAVGFSAPPATAAPSPKVCTGSGTVFLDPNGTGYNWSIQGSGFCGTVFPVQPLKTLHFNGSGTSDQIGLCSTALVVPNLDLSVIVSMTDVVTGDTTTEAQNWFSPVTIFPLVTPFLVSTSNGGNGAGVMWSHIFLQCGNEGTHPSAQFDWAQTV